MASVCTRLSVSGDGTAAEGEVMPASPSEAPPLLPNAARSFAAVDPRFPIGGTARCRHPLRLEALVQRFQGPTHNHAPTDRIAQVQR